MSLLWLTASKSQIQTRERERPPLPSSKCLNKREKLNLATSSPSETKPTEQSQLGNGQWKLKTFCCVPRGVPSHVCFRSSFFPYLIDVLNKTITKELLGEKKFFTERLCNAGHENSIWWYIGIIPWYVVTRHEAVLVTFFSQLNFTSG